MHSSLLRSVLLAALAAGCLGTGQFAVSGDVATPDLVVISPGVQVIADYDEPIFYSDNFYWRMEGGAWYRSQYHTRGWARVDNVPVTIRSIDRPSAYVHYHGERGEHREARPEVRDHREAAPEPRREERHEERRDNQPERRDGEGERKNDKKEHKNEHKDHGEGAH